MRYIPIYLADLVLVESSSVVAQWCNHVVVTPRMSKLWIGSGGYIECCRPVVQPCSCHPTPDHPSMGIPALHNVRAAWSDSPSTWSWLCWSTDQLLFKMHNMRAAWSAGEQHDLNFVDQLILLFKMTRFRWGTVLEDVKNMITPLQYQIEPKRIPMPVMVDLAKVSFILMATEFWWQKLQELANTLYCKVPKR